VLRLLLMLNPRLGSHWHPNFNSWLDVLLLQVTTADASRYYENKLTKRDLQRQGKLGHTRDIVH